MEKMKNFSLFLCASLLSVLCLSSCMKIGSVTDGQAVGVATYGYNNKLILNSTVGPVSAANLESLGYTAGSCYWFFYSHDADLPENSQNVINANGFVTVSILDSEEIPKFFLYSSLSDTSAVMPDEIAIISPFDNNPSYIDSHLFMTQAVNMPNDIQLQWNMSYSPGTMMPTEIEGSRYYDIFIRATKKNESTKTASLVQCLNAYYIGGYLQNAAQTEKSILGNNYNASTSTFKLRFNYASDINAETQKITWRSKVTDVAIAGFLPEW